jgi:Putative zinc-finger
LTEGRRAFVERLAGIRGGAECERVAPLLSLLADGELDPDELRRLRPHLRSCLACRQRLREYRDAPARIAAVMPPAAALAAGAHHSGPLRGLLEALIGSTQERAAALGERLHTATELATGQKVAAVAASAAAMAGGGATVDQLANHRGPPQSPKERVEAEPMKDEVPPPASPPSTPEPAPPVTPPTESSPAAAPAPAPPPPPPDPANEFAPGGVQPAAAGPTPPSPSSGFAPGAGGGGSASGGEGEFGP